MNINQNLLTKALDGLWVKQQVTMHNIANYSTPEYKAKQVDFETNLKKAIEQGDNLTKSELSELINDTRVQMKETNDLSMRLDGNNVDIEKENINLAETQIHYMYTIQSLNSHFSKLRTAIKGQ